jgi:rsbT co-antagonist protein RsbR
MSNERSSANGIQAQLAELQAENEQLRQQLAAQQQTEAQLRQNQQRLEYALEGSNSGLWDWLIPENQAVLSDRYRKMLGYRPDELPDSVDSWMNSIHPDDMPAVQRTVEEYLAGQRDEYMLEHRLQHKSGEWRWMLSRGKVVARSDDGQPLRMTGTVTDITERKERELFEQQLSTLVDTIGDFVGFATLEGKVGYLNPAGRALVGMDQDQNLSTIPIEEFHLPEDVALLHETILPTTMQKGSWSGEFRFRHFQTGATIPVSYTLFQVKDPDTGEVDVLGCLARDITEQKQQEEAARNSDMRLRALLDAIPDMILRISQEHIFLDYRPAQDIDAYVPPEVFLGKHVEEVLPPDVAQRIMQTGTEVLRTGERQVMEYQLAMSDGQHSYNTWVVASADNTYVLLIRDITEQKHMQEDWQRLVAIAENSPDFIGMASFEGVPLYVNPAGRALVGLKDMDHARQHQITDFFPEDVLPFAEQEILPTVMRDGFWQGEFRFRNFQTGDIIPVHYTLFLVNDQMTGTPLGIGTVTRDITEQKQQQADLEMFRTLVENAPDAISVADMTGTEFYANPVFRERTGYGDQVIGMSVPEIYNEPAATIQHVIQQVMEHGFWQGENSYRRADKQVMPNLASIFLIRNEDGTPQFIAAIESDLTEKKRQEEELRIFQTVIEHAPSGIALADATGKLSYVNRALCEMLQYKDMQGMMIFDAFPPEDQAQIVTVAQEVARGPWQGVLTYLRADGSRFPGRISAFPIYDKDNQLQLLAALTTDITDIKKSEAERAALAQQVIDAQRDALRELSTPLIPITDEVVIMPLIGTLDSQRAQQVMETLLEGVARHQARLVILDITGVQVVDTQVAQAFIQAAQAVKLLGAEVMLTGIQPQIAQTLVSLGVDLSDIQTRGSLQAGIMAAFAQR